MFELVIRVKLYRMLILSNRWCSVAVLMSTHVALLYLQLILLTDSVHHGCVCVCVWSVRCVCVWCVCVCVECEVCVCVCVCVECEVCVCVCVCGV